MNPKTFFDWLAYVGGLCFGVQLGVKIIVGLLVMIAVAIQELLS